MRAAIIDEAVHNPQIQTPEDVLPLVGGWLDAISHDIAASGPRMMTADA
jgi:hypothetical protein